MICLLLDFQKIKSSEPIVQTAGTEPHMVWLLAASGGDQSVNSAGMLLVSAKAAANTTVFDAGDVP